MSRIQSIPLFLIFIVLQSCAPNAQRPIVEAARTGAVEQIRLLAKSGADMNSPDQEGNGWTPLMHAIHTNREDSILTLIELGADVNSAGRGGQTPLMMAAGYGQAGMVALLLEHGANVRTATPDGRTALSSAVAGVPDMDRFTLGACQTETVNVLLKHDPSLRLKPSVARMIARLGRCKEILALTSPARE